eukprot:TRINITY_DN61344_c0_g1_i1.p1 TRINITY_DN61344_c0_g1~~TRINITY_DN61344_c0_g1_i1.p1  ORF type:complete len:768 (+),score=35.58 TRINITY_DN61344_c0_g1_i1:61-2364(+)
MIRSREDLQNAKRIIIKAGTGVVSTPDGFPCLSRMSTIVEHAAELVRNGKEVIIVTSGAVGVGKKILKKQALLKHTVLDVLSAKESNVEIEEMEGVSEGTQRVSYNSACAAAGQLGLMSLYSLMFNQLEVQSSQLLVTAFDFTSPERRKNIQFVISQLLAHGIVPLINENDAVSARQGYAIHDNSFADNDSLASLVSVEMNAQLLILLTDVDGVYDKPPSDPDSVKIDIFRSNQSSNDVEIGEKSTQGRGGMGAKIDAALNAVKGGVQAVVIASGYDSSSIGKVVSGENQGTIFLQEDETNDDSLLLDESNEIPSKLSTPSKEVPMTDVDVVAIAELMAEQARSESRNLQLLSSDERRNILSAVADAIKSNEKEILKVNAIDVANAEKANLTGPILKRLSLTSEKIDTLYKGIKSIANQDEPIGKLLDRTEIADKLILDKTSCPIGVLLVIFESRPDCLPQIAALALRSGNGLLLKGGKEAEHSNILLHKIIVDTVEKVSNGKVSKGVIGLITSRASIPTLLKLDQYIDLVIPRGSGEMVQNIKENTKIPVMGHAEGVCHVYVDSDADLNKALRIVIDSKTDYPSGCNAVETLLLHSSTVESNVADNLIRALRIAGVTIHAGEKAISAGICDPPAVENFKYEYGDLAITIELVDDVNEAINHIHKYGSGHTESIITENNNTAELFLKTVDAACVFHNASTRFADGFRFGLGAEVGISTGRIHARGPVGIEGLMTTKWQIRSTNENGHVVSGFVGETPEFKYTHKKLI